MSTADARRHRPRQRRRRASRRPRRRRKKKLTSPWASLAAIVIAVLWTIPTFGLLISSFRPEDEVKTSGWWTWLHATRRSPSTTTTRSCTGERHRPRDATSSTPSSSRSPRCIIPITLATLAAYAFAWMKFPGRDLLFVAIFALQIVPIQVTMIPLLTLYVDPPFGLSLAGSTPRRWLLHDLAVALDLRAAAGDLPAAQLHEGGPGRADRGGPGRRRRARADLHPDHAAADDARPSPRSASSSSSGSGTTCWWRWSSAAATSTSRR